MWHSKKELGLQILGYYGQGGYQPGGFLSSLLTTWGKADMLNRQRLYAGFPELGRMLEKFQSMDPEEFAAWLETVEEDYE